MTTFDSETRLVCASPVSADASAESDRDSMLLPPPPRAAVDVAIPRMPPIGRIRHYDAALGLWAPGGALSESQCAPVARPPEPSRFAAEEAPSAVMRGAQRNDPGSVTLSSRPAAITARRPRAA